MAFPKKRHGIDSSKLDGESEAAYSVFIKSLNEPQGWKIRSLGFRAGRVAEFSPRFLIEISANEREWAIEFDLVNSKKIMLLSVYELTG